MKSKMLGVSSAMCFGAKLSTTEQISTTAKFDSGTIKNAGAKDEDVVAGSACLHTWKVCPCAAGYPAWEVQSKPGEHTKSLHNVYIDISPCVIELNMSTAIRQRLHVHVFMES